MSGVFEGMSLREIRGMPMTAEAIPASRCHRTRPLQSKIALTQERYVRSIWEACPRWRRRKRRKLAGALSHAEHVTNMNLYPIWRMGLWAAELDCLQRAADKIGERIATMEAP